MATENEENEERKEKLQDEKDTNLLNKGLKQGAKGVKNVFKLILSKIVAAIGVPTLIYGIVIAVIVGAIISAFSAVIYLFGSSNISADASSKVMQDEEQVSIAKDESEGYYFKINKDILEKYMEELFYSDQNGFFDNVKIPDGKEDEEVEENDNEDEEENDDKEVYDDEARKKVLQDLQNWFKLEDFKEFFIRMMRAEIASSYPRLGDFEGKDGTEDGQGNKKDKDGDYVAQGIVDIKRTKMNIDGTVGEEIFLDYLPYEEFSSLVSANDISALDYFSFDENSGLLYYATYKQTTTSKNGVQQSNEYVLQENSVSYTALTSMCSMPYNFLFSLIQTSNNPYYVMAVIDLLLEKSEVILMIQDQLNVSTYTEKTAHAQKTETQRLTSQGSVKNNKIITYSWKYGNVQTSYLFPVVNTTETAVSSTYTNTASVYVKKAKTWCVEFEQGANANNTQNLGEEVSHTYTDAELAGLSYRLVSSNRGAVPSATKGSSFTITERYLSNEALTMSTKQDLENFGWNINLITEKNIVYKWFLGLWKNDTGEYYLGCEFDLNGKEVKYPIPQQEHKKEIVIHNIAEPSGETINDLVDLLSLHENTQMHEQLLKYYWNIYTGKEIYDIDISEVLDLFDTDTFTSLEGGTSSGRTNTRKFTRRKIMVCTKRCRLE